MWLSEATLRTAETGLAGLPALEMAAEWLATTAPACRACAARFEGDTMGEMALPWEGIALTGGGAAIPFDAAPAAEPEPAPDEEEEEEEEAALAVAASSPEEGYEGVGSASWYL